MDGAEFEPGDHLLVSCEPRRVEVASADQFYVYVRCPWRQPDPASRYRWDGTTAFRRDPEDYDFDRVWRLDPPPAQLQTGDSCELSIPAIEVVVTSFTRYPAPEDIGWLPRSFAVLAVAEVFDDRDEEDTAQALYLSEAVPLTIETPVTRGDWPP